MTIGIIVVARRWPALATELVRHKVDVIVTQGTPATLAVGAPELEDIADAH